MKAEAFTGVACAQRVNTDHHYATRYKALITAAGFLLMYCKLGLKTAMGRMIKMKGVWSFFFGRKHTKKLRITFLVL